MASTTRPLSPPDIESRLRAQFGDDIVAFADQDGHAVATVSAAVYHDVVRMLRDDPEFALDYCDFVSAVDWGEEGALLHEQVAANTEGLPAGAKEDHRDLLQRFEVVTHLHSTTAHHNVRLKVALPHEAPSLPTISDLYPGANWHERETLEMFGISFEGHPQPVKLLLPEPFEGHPLRKDFVLMSREAKPWPGAAEGEEAEDE